MLYYKSNGRKNLVLEKPAEPVMETEHATAIPVVSAQEGAA